MPSFGIIELNQDQEQKYYHDIGKNAEQFGMEVHRFVPSAIDPYTEKAEGETFGPDGWYPDTFSIPDILYDRCFYSSREIFKMNASIVEWLKHRTTFLGFGLPNKWKVHEVLTADSDLAAYTVNTVRASHSRSIVTELEKRKTILLKPETGSQGKGILVITKKPGGITIQTERHGRIRRRTFSSISEFRRWMDARLLQTAFLIQPFLSLQTKEKEPFDIRVVVQKDADGNWKERGRGVRIGRKDGLVANLHSAGRLISFEEWIKTRPRQKRAFLLNELDAIIEKVPNRVESSFGPLFELGLDIGIDQHEAIWILEANSKPGHQTALQSGNTSRDELAQAPLQYAQHLLRQKELTEHAAAAETQEK